MEFSRAKKYCKGFTLVELATAVSIFAIITAVSFVGWNSWQMSLAGSEVKHELETVAVAMKNELSIKNKYPLQIPAKYSRGKNVDVVYISGSENQFCIKATSSRVATVKMYLSSLDSAPSSTDCYTAPKITLQTVLMINGSTQGTLVTGSVVRGSATIKNEGSSNYTISVNSSFSSRVGLDPDQPPVLTCDKTMIAPGESSTCLTQEYIVTPAYTGGQIVFSATTN